jgi:hypothetical protein
VREERRLEASIRGRALPLALLLALALLWAAQYRPFVFPNNDFYSFRRAAWSLGAGELPKSLKRGPILPGVMAALAPALPVRQPELHAALLANLAASLAMAAALMAFAVRTFAAAAPLFCVLIATTPVLHVQALQPLVEPTLGLFVALAFLGLRARSAWQYAAAGAAALSRPETALLLGVLALANGAAERRWRLHLGLAAAAGLPFLAWNGLGALGGTGAADYLELREAFGSPALLYLVMLPKELFSGWWGSAPWQLALLALAVLAPGLAGAARALREAPRESGAMLAFFAISCLTVVLYGVGKARYLHPVAWIPLLCFALGVVDLAARAARAAARRASGARRAAVLAAAAAGVGLAGWGIARLARADSALPLAPDLAFAGFALVSLGAVCRLAGSRGGGPLAAWLVFGAAAPLVLGGVERKIELVGAVHDFDAAAGPAAHWLAEHLPAGERVAVLHRSQVIFASGLPSERVVPFARFEADTLEALRAELARRRVRYVAYTWRRPPQSDAERFYAGRRKEHLAAFFASGDPPEGFELLARLPAPARLRQPPAAIYRLRQGGGAP